MIFESWPSILPFSRTNWSLVALLAEFVTSIEKEKKKTFLVSVSPVPFVCALLNKPPSVAISYG